MKKISQILAFCLLTLGLYANNSSSLDSLCAVNVLMDSSTVNGAVIAVASPSGTAPFAYTWSNGETTESIEITQWGINYCVTMTDATGCTSVDCLFGASSCGVFITNNPGGGLTANANSPFNVSYLWSNGISNVSILPNSPGSYCVTITDTNGCTATDCANWNGGNNPLDSCSVYIVIDSTATGDVFTAIANGTAPFTYQWLPGGNTQSIPPNPAYFGQYCVTVTDADGCVAVACFDNPNCSVYISTNPAGGLIAIGSGQGPYTYTWSNGGQTPNIQPNAAGDYCVTITESNGCSATDCAFWNGIPNTCSVQITVDSFQNQGWTLTAYPIGTAPFSYNWAPLSQTGQSVTVTQPGTYCVTVTDANGCQSISCETISNSACNVYIVQEDSAGIDVLVAITNISPATYMWSNGETAQYIAPPLTGDYCVTVTGGGCVAYYCYQYLPPTNYTLLGYVVLEDSTQTEDLDGIAELFSLDPSTGDWNLAATVSLQNNPNDWTASYDFGTQPEGEYLIKVTLTPGSQYADEYLPTYYESSINWNEANVIILPNVWNGFLIIMNDGQNLTPGDGNINGIVTEGDGFTANDDDRGGDPRPNTSVLLFDENEEVITHAKTDELGRYSFANLPLGTYKVQVEIVGEEQAERWVDLTAANPTSNGNDFEVTPAGIVLSLEELLAGANSLAVSPNPTSGQLKLALDAKANFEATIKLSRLDGTTVIVENQQVAMGQQAIDFDMTTVPTGLYLLQLTTGKGVATAKIVKN